MYPLQIAIDNQTWLNGIIYEPLALIILGIIIILILIIWRIAPNFIEKKTELKILEINKNSENINYETNCIVNNISDRFNDFEKYINDNKINIFELKDDVKILRNEVKQNNKAVFRLQIFDTNLDDYSRLEAGIEYLRLGGNGKGKAKIIEVANNNPDAWDTVCRNNEGINDLIPNYFENSINDINKLLGYKQKLF